MKKIIACLLLVIAPALATPTEFLKVNPDGTVTIKAVDLANRLAEFSIAVEKAQRERDEAIKAYMNLQEMERKSNAMCS